MYNQFMMHGQKTLSYRSVPLQPADSRSLLSLGWEAGMPASCASVPCPDNTLKQILAACFHSPL